MNRRLRMLRWLLLVTAIVLGGPGSALAGPPTLPPTHLMAVAESTRLKLLACLARGDIAGAMALYEAHTGRVPPSWLQDLQVAFAVSSQAINKCQEVARTIHTAFLRLGQNPQYVALRAKERYDFMTFDLVSGKSPTVTSNGYHVAVMLEGKVYDAYTGPLGMKLEDYLSRLHAPAGVVWNVVTTP
ncbi:hypothetical protein F0U60_49585 [Archangium minus]|uniref:Tox-PL-2 domain-containing protein n=1 Tax=Archangium minus TaxID=83450 RepID=A0ABY9X7C9_9BACT|nr:hypothetical protein F0U60_49585 [Archangium minus]